MRSLVLLTVAGATRVHLDDFHGLLARPFKPGWRLWRGDANFDAPPARAAVLPGWLAYLDDDGTLTPTPPEHGWLHMLAAAPALRSLSLENGHEEDPSVTAPALYVALCSLSEAPALRKLALGFFDRLESEQLQPLMQLRALTRLELSHVPDFSDQLLGSACRSLRALTHLRLDYLSVSDAGFLHLDSLKSLAWLEIRVRLVLLRAPSQAYVHATAGMPIRAVRAHLSLRCAHQAVHAAPGPAGRRPTHARQPHRVGSSCGRRQSGAAPVCRLPASEARRASVLRDGQAGGDAEAFTVVAHARVAVRDVAAGGAHVACGNFRADAGARRPVRVVRITPAGGTYARLLPS